MKLRCLVVALALLVAFASDSWGQSKQPTPPPTQSAQPNQTSKPYERGTEQSPVIVKMLPTKEGDDKAAADARREDEKTENDRRLALFTERLFWATVALSVIALFQLFVFGWQGVQLKRSVSTANKEFIATHRPKLVVRHITVHAPKADQPFSATVCVANVGGSSAIIFDNKIVLKCAIWSRTRSELDGATTFEYGKEIRPGEMAGPITIQSGKFLWDLAPPNDPLIYGYILYRDHNGIERRTAFFRRYAGGVWEANGPGGHPDQEYQD
jgi:hypothetical protein